MCVLPYAECSGHEPIANSSMFVLPRIGSPAALMLSTSVALYGGTQPSRIFEPAVVGSRGSRRTSLTAIGTPGERVQLLARGASGVDVRRGGERLVVGHVQERVHGGVDGGDAVQVRPRRLDARTPRRPAARPPAGGGEPGQVALMRPPPGSAGRGTSRPAPPAPREHGVTVDRPTGTSARNTFVSGRGWLVAGTSGVAISLTRATDSTMTSSSPASRSSSAGVRSIRASPATRATSSRERVDMSPSLVGASATVRSTAAVDERRGARSAYASSARLGREQLLRPARDLDEDLERALGRAGERAERAAQHRRAAGPRAAATARPRARPSPAPTRSSR